MGIGIGLGVGVGMRAAGGAAAPTPPPGFASLFRSDQRVYSDTGGTTPAAVGDPVGAWKDAQGHTLAASSDANRLAYAAGYDGYPSVLNSSGAATVSLTGPLAIAANDYTMFAVYRINATVGYQYVFCFDTNNNCLAYDPSGPTVFFYNGTLFQPSRAVPRNWEYAVIRVKADGSVTVRINSVEVMSGASTPSGFPTTTLKLNQNGLGALATVSHRVWGHYGTALSDAQILQLEAYLATIAEPVSLETYKAMCFVSNASEVPNLLTSNGGTSFRRIITNLTGLAGGESFRDGSLNPAGVHSGKYWCVFTSTGIAAGTKFGVASSTDLENWAQVKSVSTAGIVGTGFSWGPKFARFSTDGTPRVTITLAVNDGDPFQPYEMHPTTSDWTSTWSSPTLITGTAIPANCIDWYGFKVGSTYFAVCKDEDSKYLHLVSSSSAFSGYDTGRELTELGANLEGCSMVVYSDTHWRLYADDYNGDRGGGMMYTETTDGGTSFGASFTPIVAPTTTRNGVFLFG